MAREDGKPQRYRNRNLRDRDDRADYRLGDVAEYHLVLVGLGSEVPGRTRLRSAGAGCALGDSVVEVRAHQDDPADDGTARSRQVHVCLRDAEYLSHVRRVPNHVVGQHSGGDSLVPGPHPRWLVVHLHAGFLLPLADSLLPAAVARYKAQQTEDVVDLRLHALCTVRRPVLDYRAELRRLRRQPAPGGKHRYPRLPDGPG